MSQLAVVTCRHAGPDKAAAYRTLIEIVDAELAYRGDHAVVITDGDPSNPDPHVRQAYRDLDIRTRRIIEDGWTQPAHASQLIQMVDLVAHCAFQAHRRRHGRQFMWDWYATHLHPLAWNCACPG